MRWAFFEDEGFILSNIENIFFFWPDSNHQFLSYGLRSLPMSYLTCWRVGTKQTFIKSCMSFWYKCFFKKETWMFVFFSPLGKWVEICWTSLLFKMNKVFLLPNDQSAWWCIQERMWNIATQTSESQWPQL